MRYKFIILFLILGFVSKAQVYQLMPQYGYSTYRMNFDSTIQIPTFCGVPKLGSNKINKGALAFDSCNNRFYFFNPKLQVWDTIKSADASLFVKYTDTAQMLSAYLRKTDTISLSNRIEGKIDSLKLSNDSIYARKNNQFVFQYMNDTATVVKAFVRNVESFTINRGQVVYIFGASGDKASVKLADNSGDYTSSRTLGIVRENIAAGQTGWVTTQGQVAKLQLGSYNEGDVLWLDSIPGGFTKTKPVAPRHSVFLGIVERANNGNGIAYVKPQNGYEIGELHDVKITSPATNQVLAYTTNIWENKNIYSIVDTLGLSNRINTKLNISDTSAMLSPYLRSIDTTNKYVTSVFRKTASDSVFFVRGGTNNFAFRDSAGGANIYNTDGTLTGNRTLSLGGNSLKVLGSDVGASNYILTLENNNTSAGFPTRNGLLITTTGSVGGAQTASLPLLIRNYGSDVFSVNGVGAISTASTITANSNITGARLTGTSLVVNGNNTGLLTSQIRAVASQTANLTEWQNSGGTALNVVTAGGNMIVGGSTDVASAKLQVAGTTQGFLQPRLTTTQMNAISTPATGLSVFNTTDSAVYIRRGTGAGWQQVANEIIATGTLDFANTNAQNSTDLTITLTGAVDGDAVVLGVPNAAVNANSCYTAWVSAANTVTVRFNNYSSGAINPASATFKVTIIK